MSLTSHHTRTHTQTFNSSQGFWTWSTTLVSICTASKKPKAIMLWKIGTKHSDSMQIYPVKFHSILSRGFGDEARTNCVYRQTDGRTDRLNSVYTSPLTTVVRGYKNPSYGPGYRLRRLLELPFIGLFSIICSPTVSANYASISLMKLMHINYSLICMLLINMHATLGDCI